MPRMVDIDEFLPELLVLAPKCPEPLAFRYLRDAAVELCERTRVWTETDQVSITAPRCEYICVSQDAQLVGWKNARLDGRVLDTIRLDELDDIMPDWQDQDADIAAARWITQSAPNTLSIVPRQTGTLKLRLILKPSRRALSFPEFLLDHHATAIAKGAAARVLTTPSEFANPELGSAYHSDFKATLDSLALKEAKGQQGARLRTKGSYF